MAQKLPSSLSAPILPPSPVVKQPVEAPKSLSSVTDQKTQQVFIAKNPAAAQQGGDSDEELAIPMGKMAPFQRKTPIPVEATTIQCRDEKGEVKNIKGSTLIEIVHDSVQNWYFGVVDCACEYEKELDGAVIPLPTLENDVLHMQQPREWIMTLGGWKGMMPSEEVKDYFFWFSAKKRKFSGVQVFKNGVVFSIRDGRLHITKDFSISKYNVTTAWKKTNNGWEKDPLGKTDLSYNQIIKAIDHIKMSFKLTDSALATLQLCVLNHSEKIPPGILKETPVANQKEILLFLDYLNCLMFGIEASGLNAAITISLMTLDLIKEGHLDYSTAFKANEDGGVYPYACFGNNSGTYSKREEILLHRKAKRESKSMREFRENPSLSPVAVKEATMIREWLRVNQVFTGEKQYDLQLGEIGKAVNDILSRYFSPWLRTEWFLTKFKEANAQYHHDEEVRMKAVIGALSAKQT